MMPGKVVLKYLNKGDENGKSWIPAEAEVSIRPGWFWHENENNKVRSASNLVNLYYQSVGRNSLLLLKIPPNKDGLIDERDILAIDSLRTILDGTFALNMAKGKIKKELSDKKLGTFISIQENEPLIIDLGKEQTFDRLLMRENIQNGQLVKQGQWEYWDGNNWKPIQTFSTIGRKKLLRFNTVKSSKLRLTITQSKYKQLIQLSEIGVYKASAGEYK